ncbi:MAG: ribosomal RNA small subunit methyltransferase A [Candidatus Bathyarchaeota archaeon]|nr:MAG: ribosomal RNA small subunit methyltransferase A [Candidatus Bathyarchaeota archaeon]
MNLYRKAKHLMRVHKIFPKKHLGQNFMVDENFLQLMVYYAGTKPNIVLEPGAGFGFLTRLLAQKSKKVLAVEKDTRLVKILREELSNFSNVELIEGDILKIFLPAFDEVVSNPPFSISSPLLFLLLKRNFNHAVLTFQTDFAKRLNAEPGSKNYSRLTVSTYYHAEVELYEGIPKEAFYPQPDVSAVIVRLKPKKKPFHVKDEKIFEEVLRILFTQRNRKVRNAIQPFLSRYKSEDNTALKEANHLPFHNKRVRDLAPEDFGVLANEFTS